MTADLGSRSDLDALTRSGRGKIMVVVLLLLLAVGGAVWSFSRDEGIGNPETPLKVLVVSRGTVVGYSAFLEDLGFDAAEGTLAAWETKAQAEVEGLEESGVAAVLTLADKFGYGYVAFEAPADVDLSGLDLDQDVPPFEDHVEFAVLSVGDFAFPHRVTVNPEPSPVIRDSGMSLLQALFAQHELAATLPDNEKATIEDIQRRDQLSDALDRLSRIPAAQEMADKIVADIDRVLRDDERGDATPTLLGETFESASPIPLSSGPVLTVARGFQVVTSDAVRADLELDPEERFFFGAPGAAPGARKVCSALSGGQVAADDAARYVFAPGGDAVVVKTLSAGVVLWRLGEGQGCAFERVGEIPAPSPGFAGSEGAEVGVPHRSGKVVRAGVIDGRGALEVTTAGADDRQLLGMMPGVELVAPVWIDATRLVAVGHDETRGAALYVFDVEQPLSVLVLPSSLFENAGELAEVAAVPGNPARLVVTAGAFPRKVYRLDAPGPWGSLFDDPPRAPEVAATEDAGAELGEPPPDPPEPTDDEDAPGEADEPPPGPEAGMPVAIVLDTNAFVATPITSAGRAGELAVSPDGRRVAFAIRDKNLDRPDASDDQEIAIATLEAGREAARMQLLTRNAITDHTPRFTADGRHVVFSTRVDVPRTNWHITVARAVEVGSASTP